MTSIRCVSYICCLLISLASAAQVMDPSTASASASVSSSENESFGGDAIGKLMASIGKAMAKQNPSGGVATDLFDSEHPLLKMTKETISQFLPNSDPQANPEKMKEIYEKFTKMLKAGGEDKENGFIPADFNKLLSPELVEKIMSGEKDPETVAQIDQKLASLMKITPQQIAELRESAAYGLQNIENISEIFQSSFDL